MNRLLGFSGTPTDEELDEVLELGFRMFMRVLTNEQFLDTMKQLQQLQLTFARMFQGFGDA